MGKFKYRKVTESENKAFLFLDIVFCFHEIYFSINITSIIILNVLHHEKGLLIHSIKIRRLCKSETDSTP